MGAAHLKNGFIRSQKYSPMQPWVQAIVISANCTAIMCGRATQ